MVGTLRTEEHETRAPEGERRRACDREAGDPLPLVDCLTLAVVALARHAHKHHQARDASENEERRTEHLPKLPARSTRRLVHQRM